MSESLAAPPDFVPPGNEIVTWRRAMQLAIRTEGELRAQLGIDEGFTRTQGDGKGGNSFPVFVPREFLRRIRREDPHDPLLRQVLPVEEEFSTPPGYSMDPVGEIGTSAIGASGSAMIRKYHGRALLIAHPACGIHCRYCFRRHFPYDEITPGAAKFTAAIAAIADDTTLSEVILSGGDPLVLGDKALAQLILQLAEVPHVMRLRIHSRMPIVIPQRVTAELIASLRSTRLTPWMVVHCNHPNELDEHTLHHLGLLVDAGIPVLNQAVLLAGVNDNEQVLEQLCTKLIDHRIQPYYLHQLDRVMGAAHFEVCDTRGIELIKYLRERLPGYAVPQFVREIAGRQSKTPVADFAQETSDAAPPE